MTAWLGLGPAFAFRTLGWLASPPTLLRSYGGQPPLNLQLACQPKV